MCEKCVGLLALAVKCVLSYESVICMVVPTTPMTQVKNKPNVTLRRSGQSWKKKTRYLLNLHIESVISVLCPFE